MAYAARELRGRLFGQGSLPSSGRYFGRTLAQQPLVGQRPRLIDAEAVHAILRFLPMTDSIPSRSFRTSCGGTCPCCSKSGRWVSGRQVCSFYATSRGSPAATDAKAKGWRLFLLDKRRARRKDDRVTCVRE